MKYKKRAEKRAQFNYTLDRYRYELLARLAYDTRARTIQQLIDGLLFGKDWMAELEEKRAQHRKLKIPDRLFYPTHVLREMGLKPRRGRLFKKRRRRRG